MRRRTTSLPPSRAIPSIFVPPRSIPMRRGTPRAYNPFMSRRRFLKATAVIGAGVATGAFRNAGAAFAQQRTAPRSATTKPIRILLAGYAPPNNGFSLSLKRIGERVQTKFGWSSVLVGYGCVLLSGTLPDQFWVGKFPCTGSAKFAPIP